MMEIAMVNLFSDKTVTVKRDDDLLVFECHNGNIILCKMTIFIITIC